VIAVMFSGRIKRGVGLQVSIVAGGIVALLFIPLLLGAQEGQILVESSVDRATITVGDPVTYTLTITRAESVVVRPPEMGINLGQFEIRDYEIVEPQMTDAGLITERYSFVISVYDVGEFEIPPLTISYTDLQGQQREIRSQAIDITVNSVKPSEAEDIKDIKPPVEMRGTRNVYLWVGVALLCIFAALILIFLWRRKRAVRKIGEEELGPPRPAYEIAYEELERVENLNLIDRGFFKLYYTELSEILRRYIGQRYRIITMELTTAELVDSMEEEEIEEVHIEEIRLFLEECDLVKFAKFIPPKEEMDAAISKARAIVDATKETLLGPADEVKDEVVEEAGESMEAEPVGADAESSVTDGP
jgi:hypothetical protein